MKLLLLLLCLLFKSSAAKELTIHEAIETAKKHRPNLQALEYKIREEKLKVKEAWSGYLPQLQLVTNYTYGNSANSAANPAVPVGGVTTGIQAQQLIYQFGGPQQQAKIAQAGVNIALFNKTTQEAAVAYEVTKTFIDCWVLQQQEALFKQLETSSRRLFNKAKQERNAALVDKQDFLGSVETRAFAHEQVAGFQQDAIVAQAQLKFLLGYKQPITLLGSALEKRTTLAFVPLKPTAQGLLPSSTEFVSKALKNRPEIKQMDHRIDLERQTVKLEKVSTAPRLSLTGNAYHVGALPPAYRGQFEGGISLSWPILDGGRTHYRQQEADARMTAAMLQKEQLTQEITLQVEQAYHLLSRSTYTYQAQQIALQRAESLFSRKERELRLGIITPTALEEARTTLLQTKNRWILAQADIAQKIALLNYRCGEIA